MMKRLIILSAMILFILFCTTKYALDNAFHAEGAVYDIKQNPLVVFEISDLEDTHVIKNVILYEET